MMMLSAAVVRWLFRCFFVYWSVLFLLISVETRNSDDDGGQTVDHINAARCAVRCLSAFQNRLLFGSSSTAEVSLLRRCQLDAVCSECSRPCSQPFVNINDCETWCSSSSAQPSSGVVDCTESCRFLRQVNTIRPGTCPPETQVTGFAALCIVGCDSDADCNASLKCCSNGCGWTCQAPTHIDEGKPDVPSAPTITSTNSADSVLLHWLPLGHSNVSGTILYLVEMRSSVSRRTSAHGMSSWRQIAQTVDPRSVVDGMRPGRWIQFRVSSVNIYGSRRPSNASQPFKLSKDPDRPGPPTNLTQGDSLIKDNKVTVTLHWSPPAVSDLPIARYKIYWSKRLRLVSAQLQSMQEYRQVVSGERHSCRVMDLDPDTAYFVQVQAISQHGDVRLKSDRASLYITTYPLPRSSGGAIQSPVAASVPPAAQPRPSPPTPNQLTIIETYYQNGLLKANISWSFDDARGRDERPDKLLVYWSAEGCSSDLTLDEPPVMSATTHVNFFTIYDLRFGCRYLIRVQAVTIHGVTSSMAYSFLDTPQCGQTLVIGEVQPDCPRSGGRLPGEPIDLQYKFIEDKSNISVRLSWNLPMSAVLSPISGFRVVWGLVQSGSHFLLIDQSAATHRDVPKDVLAVVLANLQGSTTYAAVVQAVSRAGRGRVASLRFTTPVFRPPVVVVPPYVDVSRGRIDSVRPNSVKKKAPAAVQPQNSANPYSPIMWTLRFYNSNGVQISTPLSNSGSSLLSSVFVLPTLNVVLITGCLFFSLLRLFVS